MARDQIERAYEREQDALDTRYANGDLTDAEYREATRDLERTARDEMRGDLEEAHRRVDEEYGF